MTTVIRGENRHLLRSFTQSDASPLLLASLSSLEVSLFKGVKPIITYTLGTNAELVADPTDIVGNRVRLELTEAFTLSNEVGSLTEVWKLSRLDGTFVSGVRIDKITTTDVTLA